MITVTYSSLHSKFFWFRSRRKGVKSLVLESSPTMRATGFAFTIWTNAWRALDALGVGDKVRDHHLLLER